MALPISPQRSPSTPACLTELFSSLADHVLHGPEITESAESLQYLLEASLTNHKQAGNMSTRGRSPILQTLAFCRTSCSAVLSQSNICTACSLLHSRTACRSVLRLASLRPLICWDPADLPRHAPRHASEVKSALHIPRVFQQVSASLKMPASCGCSSWSKCQLW